MSISSFYKELPRKLPLVRTENGNLSRFAPLKPWRDVMLSSFLVERVRPFLSWQLDRIFWTHCETLSSEFSLKESIAIR